MTINIKLELNHNYSIEVVNDFQNGYSNEKLFYFPKNHPRSGVDGLQVKVTSSSNSEGWYGNFAFGDEKSSQKNGIYSCPDETRVCVISNGKGYIVNSLIPEDYQELKIFPIKEVIQVCTCNLLLFVDFTNIIAWGDTGQIWVSDRISLDGLKITNLDSKYIYGNCWHPAISDGISQFRLDLKTGKHEFRHKEQDNWIKCSNTARDDTL